MMPGALSIIISNGFAQFSPLIAKLYQILAIVAVVSHWMADLDLQIERVQTFFL
jgi:hypothetical protein